MTMYKQYNIHACLCQSIRSTRTLKNAGGTKVLFLPNALRSFFYHVSIIRFVWAVSQLLSKPLITEVLVSVARSLDTPRQQRTEEVDARVGAFRRQTHEDRGARRHTSYIPMGSDLMSRRVRYESFFYFVFLGNVNNASFR